jgi:hypothetical protein
VSSTPRTEPLRDAAAGERYVVWLMAAARTATAPALRGAATLAFGLGLALGVTALGDVRAGPLSVVGACATGALVGLEKHASP